MHTEQILRKKNEFPWEDLRDRLTSLIADWSMNFSTQLQNNCFQCSPMITIMRFGEMSLIDTLLLNGWYLNKQYVISVATNCSIYKKSMTKENTVQIYKINNK